MQLDQDRCYRALKSRDARFDGQFFTGVLTTGVYCRPICPAPTPRRGNVRFFPCAAAAQEAGFRPCLRCRPETSPGTPAWEGTSTTVSRALRLIGEGALDEGRVEELAGRLGVGARHLRRLFMEHLGVTPVAVAQTRRLHFAKKLIDETSLSMGEIAFSSGYSSIRRFNAAFRQVYGRSPRELRRGAKPKAGASGGAPLRLRLAYRPPLAWEAMLRFLRDRATAGIESVEDGVYRRSLEVGGSRGILEVGHDGTSSALTLKLHLDDARGIQAISTRVRRMFDLDCHPTAIATALKADTFLRPAVNQFPGLRVPGAWDPFELGVRVILGQQISVKGATTLAGRVVRAYGRPLEASWAPAITHLYPSPEDLADADLVRLGVVKARAKAIQTFARAILDRRVLLDGSVDFEEAAQALVALPGLGPWTAQMIAMRALRDPDAFPAADLGIIRALHGQDERPRMKAILERSENWRPWRAYAALYLWKMNAAGGVVVSSRKPSLKRKAS